jgi:Ca-activated chloride channel family protein
VRHKTRDGLIGSWAHRLIGLSVHKPISLLLSLALIAWINPQADKTKEGNRSYSKELYDEAMTKYTEVLIDSPNSPYIHFNIGNAAYKKEDYEEAIKSYTKAASLAADTILESKAYYNLGNCQYRQGRLKENTNLGEAISLYRQALEYYKQALDKNPADANAKYNHEFVERKIKELLDKQQQEQQEQTGEQQQEQQEQAEEPQEQQSQQEQPEEDDKSQGEDKNAEQNEVQAANAQPQEAQEGQKEEQEKKEGLTAEEAKMLLDSLKDEELSQLQRPRDRRSFPRVLKDW